MTSVLARALYNFTGRNENELSFVRGQTIVILTEDPSGWWTGEVGGKRGIFPASYVKKLSKRASRCFTTEEITHGIISNYGVSLSGSGSTASRAAAHSASPFGVGSMVRTSYAYTAQNENQINLEPGDIVEVISPTSDEGWWMGLNKFTGQIGVFPATYVKPLSSTHARAEALYDYEPKADNQLGFSKGTKLNVFRLTNAGWWKAQDPSTGKYGLVPSTFVSLTSRGQWSAEELGLAEAAPSAQKETVPKDPTGGNAEKLLAELFDLKTDLKRTSLKVHVHAEKGTDSPAEKAADYSAEPATDDGPERTPLAQTQNSLQTAPPKSPLSQPSSPLCTATLPSRNPLARLSATLDVAVPQSRSLGSSPVQSPKAEPFGALADRGLKRFNSYSGGGGQRSSRRREDDVAAALRRALAAADVAIVTDRNVQQDAKDIGLAARESEQQYPARSERSEEEKAKEKEADEDEDDVVVVPPQEKDIVKKKLDKELQRVTKKEKKREQKMAKQEEKKRRQKEKEILKQHKKALKQQQKEAKERERELQKLKEHSREPEKVFVNPLRRLGISLAKDHGSVRREQRALTVAHTDGGSDADMAPPMTNHVLLSLKAMPHSGLHDNLGRKRAHTISEIAMSAQESVNGDHIPHTSPPTVPSSLTTTHTANHADLLAAYSFDQILKDVDAWIARLSQRDAGKKREESPTEQEPAHRSAPALLVKEMIESCNRAIEAIRAL